MVETGKRKSAEVVSAARASGRNDGIDLLRIVSMFMIVCLHVLGQGGAMRRLSSRPATYNAAWLLEVLCFGSVNLYGMISGYVGIRTDFKAGRILRIFFQLYFYSILMTGITWLISPALVDREIVIGSLFPLSMNTYWYMSAYVVAFVFSPFVNRMIRALSDWEKRVLAGLLIGVFSIWTFMPRILETDTMSLVAGYSFVWLEVLYVLGACLGSLPARKRRAGVYAAVYLLSAAAGWALKIGLEEYTRRVMGEAMYGRKVISYHSPFILIGSIALLLWFSQIRLCSGRIRELVRFLAPSTLAVYLIHVHPVSWQYLIKGAASSMTYLPWPLLIPAVLLAALGIYLTCSLADRLRISLFALCRVDALCGRVTRWVQELRDRNRNADGGQ
ncbi:MAG: acyltransferase [Lachnospiraceae bacterium]|nr:acyltransferase [Lachnospiraceae bacterium]